jgi:prolyl 4-hydroxylase
VRAALNTNKAVQRVPVDQAELWLVPDFFDCTECGRLMSIIDTVARPSLSYDGGDVNGFRTSYSGDVDPHDPFILKLQRRIDRLLDINPPYGETIQGQRYLPGQQFQAHTDWFPVDTPYWEQERVRGGQRSFTAMAFLNPVEEGGTTDFPSIGMRIEPRPGALLMWNNADEDGVPNPWTLHAGRPVIRGVKYIITKWYRTRNCY